jgi:hypothetical protein
MIKFIIKILFSALVITTLMEGFVYTRMSHLSDDDLVWVNNFEIGDTISFISNRGNKSTLTITDKFIHNQLWPFYFSEGNSGIYAANAGYYYQINQMGNLINGLLFITKHSINRKLYILSSLGRRKTDCTKLCDPYRDLEPEFIDICHSDILLKTNTISLNGKIYHDCVIINETNSTSTTLEYQPEDTLDNQINEFIISKKHGLLYYRLTDGESFYQVIK